MMSAHVVAHQQSVFRNLAPTRRDAAIDDQRKTFAREGKPPRAPQTGAPVPSRIRNTKCSAANKKGNKQKQSSGHPQFFFTVVLLNSNSCSAPCFGGHGIQVQKREKINRFKFLIQQQRSQNLQRPNVKYAVSNFGIFGGAAAAARIADKFRQRIRPPFFSNTR